MEEWRVINNFPDYEVSSLGRVKSLKYGKERIMKPAITKKGYYRLSIQYVSCFIHSLVAEAFIPRVEGKDFVDHIDRCKTNNMVSNLRWVTGSENSLNTKDINNQLGHRNIRINTPGFEVQIVRNQKLVLSKTFRTLDEAIQVRDEFLSK